MGFTRSVARDIDKKLRDDFRNRLREVHVAENTADPLLAILFRTFATELEALSLEAERVQTSLLDELIENLEFARRSARPAQTIVKFFLEDGSCMVEAGTEIVTSGKSQNQVTFTTDAPLSVSSATIAFAATYHAGSLRIVPGIEGPENVSGSPFSLESVHINMGPTSAILIAVENLPQDHLSHHGFFIELNSFAADVQRFLLTESWCLAGPGGEFRAKGILRPRRANAGGRQLHWLLKEEEADSDGKADVNSSGKTASLPDGPYGGRNFTFPDVPPDRRFLCQIPRGLTSALRQIVGGDIANDFFREERAWIRIAMPREILDLHSAISNISLHTVSASNVETLNQTVHFAKHGTSVPVSREAGTARYLVAPCAVLGEEGPAYVPESETSADSNVGRYSIRNGIMSLRPARRSEKGEDRLANLRLWVTDGAAANGIEPGQVRNLLSRRTHAGLRFTNVTTAVGGTDAEKLQEARAKFAHSLLSRDRIVTTPDLIAAVQAFDRRIRHVELDAGLSRSERGLKRTQRLTIVLEPNDFQDAHEEGRILEEELGHYCRSSFVDDAAFVVNVVWQ